MNTKDTLIIKGAREHNLKNVSLMLPKDKLVVFTGVSGSGKSSMAFDTIFAEGQRRYVESLSSYARQFLGMVGKPNVEQIIGLSPAISIDQKSVSSNPRSTVGTITEIYDYLRLMYARVGHPFCPKCHIEIARMSVDEITQKTVAAVSELTSQHKLKPLSFQILSPVVTNRKGEFADLFDNLRQKGFTKVIIDGKNHSLDSDILLIKTNKHTISAVIDIFSLSKKQISDPVFAANLKSRLFESIEQSMNLSDGTVEIVCNTEGINWRHLFSEKFTCPQCGLSLPEIEPRLFSFNSPLGACSSCKGLGFVTRINPDLILNKKLTIDEGAITPFAKLFFHETWYSRLLRVFLEDENIDSKTTVGALSDAEREKILYGNGKLYKVTGKNRFGKETAIWEKYTGIIPELERRYAESSGDYAGYELGKYMEDHICTTCKGRRLKDEVLGITVNGLNIYEIGELSIESALGFVEKMDASLTQFEREVVHEIIREVKSRLSFLSNVGLTYLTLNRTGRTLSGGESQRIRLASQIGSGLTGVMYVLDEPSIGLHARDVTALVSSIKNLRDIGNSVIIVEHDRETIESADYIVDFGLYAGKKGGRVVYAGDLAGLKKNNESLTAKYLFKKTGSMKPASKKRHTDSGMVRIVRASQYNLKKVTAEFPLGRLICVTGVSGSGKSTLIVETLYKGLSQLVEETYRGEPGTYDVIEGYQYLDKIYLVDQAPIGRTPRSNPATYVGVFDHIRDLFAQTSDAKLKGYKKGRFSFNVKGGRCEKCGGAGSLKIEMQFLPDVYVTCDICSGYRYNSETLAVKFKGKNIYDVLSMTVDEACEFFKSHPQIHHVLKTVSEVGLGYIELGQPAPTLSGGEAQRVKLAHELAKKDSGRTLYIFDEPTTGLHFYDIEKLVATLSKLVDRGNTVVVIEHNLDVVAASDYVIDLGPDGGAGGGTILYQGDVEGIMKSARSFTGHYLKQYLLSP